jgi:hypothetical protein
MNKYMGPIPNVLLTGIHTAVPRPICQHTGKSQTVIKSLDEWSNFIPVSSVLGGPREPQIKCKYTGTKTA